MFYLLLNQRNLSDIYTYLSAIKIRHHLNKKAILTEYMQSNLCFNVLNSTDTGKTKQEFVIFFNLSGNQFLENPEASRSHISQPSQMKSGATSDRCSKLHKPVFPLLKWWRGLWALQPDSSTRTASLPLRWIYSASAPVLSSLQNRLINDLTLFMTFRDLE